MTQHSTRAASTLPSNSLWGRLLKRPWPAQLVIVAALLLAIPFLFHAGSTVHAADNEISGVTLTSLNPGELAITWDAPSDAPDDYRVTWKKSDGKWTSYKDDNTALGGNAFPTGTSHTVSDLEEGTEYSVRVRARYHDGNGNVEQSGPWSTTQEITVSATPAENTEGDSNEGDSNEGRSTSPPAKPEDLLAAATHSSVLLYWTDPGDDTITGYQILRGPDAANLAVLTDDTGSASPSYTDNTVTAETTYAYAIRARNADGLSPQTDAVSTTTQAAPVLPAKPTGLLPGRSHDRVLLFWDDPDDDTITGYQILRGLDADSLTVLTNDTGTASASYTDDTVEAETEYFYAIRARNAQGLGPQSDTVSVTTQEAPEELVTEEQVAGVDFTLDGQELDTTSTCTVSDITSIVAACTINILNSTVPLTIDGMIDVNDQLSIKVGRDKDAVDAATRLFSHNHFPNDGDSVNVPFQAGRNLLLIWGDEDGGGPTAATEHFFRINLVPYWELNGEVLSKDSDCRDITANAPTVDEITDDDCIVTQFGNTAELRFFNVINEHFNVYVEVDETNVINEPSTSDLGSSFTVNLDTGDNLIRIRLAAKGGQPLAETYDSDSFYYKVTATASTDATLSDLQVHDSLTRGDPPVPLTPAFDPVVTEYYVTVANAIALVALAAKPNDTNATVEFLDEDDSTMTADYEVGDFHWLEYDIDAGNNVFRVKVTAEDASTTKTYQVTVTRVDFLVSNAGRTSDSTNNTSITRTAIAIQFTTGNELGGYEISTVQLNVEAPTGTTPKVSIYSDNSGMPGSSIKELTNPGTIPTSRTETDFDAGDYQLDPGTGYWIVMEAASGGTEVVWQTVESTSEDPGTALGWSIGNRSFALESGTWSGNSDAFRAIPQMVIKGQLATTTTPGAPASLTAAPGNTQVTLHWTPPASDGGAAIIKYQYRVSVDGGTTWAPDWTDVPDGTDERRVRVTSLANGTLYTFQVRAVNSEGDGTAAQATATPLATTTTPGAPASLTATPGNAQVTLTWTPPTSDGGAAITKYQYRVSVDGGTTWAPDWTDVPDGSDTGTDQADERGVRVTSLANGTLHTFQVRAVNSEGDGGAAQDTATPLGAPGAPASLTATPGNTQVALTWTAPASDGGAAITKYQYRVSDDGGSTWSPDWTDVPDGSDTGTDQADERSVTITSLANGTLHTFEVRAVNSEGDGAAAQTTATPTAIITLAADFTSIIRELHELTFTLTRAGSTALAADVTLMVENATGDSVITASGRTETLTFQVGDDTVEFAVPLFWIRSSRPTGSFVATVEAGAEYDASAATATVEVVDPTGTLINVSLDKTSYQVTEGDNLTFNVVFNVLEEIAAPNRDISNILAAVPISGTAQVNDDFTGTSIAVDVPPSSWTLVADRYIATVSRALETKDDALYERPMGSHESFEIDLQRTGATPSWVTLQGPTTGTTRYPVTIRDNETLTLNAELSSTGLTSGASLRIDEDAGETITLTVTNSDLASDGNPVTLPPGVKLKITPDIPTNRGATETDDWTITPDEIDLGGTATITIIDDMLEEGPESVTFEVGFDDDEMFQSARATLTINDDEYTGPVLQSAAINGRELTLEFSNTLDTTSRPATSSFVVKVRGTAVSLSSSNPVSISGSTVTLRLRSAVTAGDTVTVSYTAPGANPIKDDAALEAPSFTDEPVTNNTPNAPATGKPVISGTPQRDETLTVSTSGIRDDDGLSNPRYVYSWLRVDGENQSHVSPDPFYLLTRDDIGKKMKVTVGFFDDAGKFELVESDLFPRSGTIQNKPNRQPTGRPTLSGTYQVGHTLTADTSDIDDRDGLTNPGYTYQWQRLDVGGYTDITGATAMVYTLTEEDESQRLRVEVTFTDDDDNSHTLESFPSGVVQAQTSLPSDKVKVSLDATAYVVEEGDTVQVTVTLAEAPEEGPVYIGFTLTPGNGATRSEFRAWSSSSSDSLRFATGETTDWIKIRADDDTLNDDGETITLCLDDLPEPYATLAGLDCATINILDNDDPNSVQVSFDRGNYWASEDGNPAWPRISVHPVPDREISIPITFTPGGGLSAADHEAVTTRVTFGPGQYGVHGDGHLSDNRTYASFPIEIWAIDDRHDDDDEYLDLAFGALPPFVTKDTGYRLGGDSRAGFRRPADQSRVWFNDNEFTQVSVTDPPNPLGLSRQMRVTFADAELEAKEGLYEIGTVATVRVQLSRPRNKESTVTIPITVTRHGTATAADYARADIPSSITFLPGQTEYSFRVRAVNDDIDDDDEYLTLTFGRLPNLVIAGDTSSVRIDLVDNDDPPVEVSFEQANYEVTSTYRSGRRTYARLDVKVKLSAAPERFVDVGIVAESTRGGGRIHLGSSAYIPRGPHSGAAFDADETEFTVTVVMSATDGFDPNQTYQLSFEGMSDRVSVGTPATATITINANP